MGQSNRSNRNYLSLSKFRTNQMQYIAKISFLLQSSGTDSTHLTRRKVNASKLLWTWSIVGPTNSRCISEEMDKLRNQPSTIKNSSKNIPTTSEKSWSHRSPRFWWCKNYQNISTCSSILRLSDSKFPIVKKRSGHPKTGTCGDVNGC